MLCLSASAYAEQVERWGCFELTLKAQVSGNPFDKSLSAVFTNGARSIEVRGFYDGDDTWRIRFMPDTEGEWTYVTSSRVSALNRKKGSLMRKLEASLYTLRLPADKFMENSNKLEEIVIETEK